MIDENPSAGEAERVALVTGGARGIGADICRRLASDGCAVAVNYVSSAGAANELVGELRASGARAMAVGADVAEPGAVASMFAAVDAALGPPTILVNNAGVSVPAGVARMSVAEWDRSIAVNLSGAFYCTRLALERMSVARWGRVVFLGSAAGRRSPMPGLAAYGAAKAGLVAMTAALAMEVASRGITVNTVVPGYVETDMVRQSGADVVAVMDRTWPKVPPTAVADTIGFLVSDAGRFVSGEDVAVWAGGPSPLVAQRRLASSRSASADRSGFGEAAREHTGKERSQ